MSTVRWTKLSLYFDLSEIFAALLYLVNEIYCWNWLIWKSIVSMLCRCDSSAAWPDTKPPPVWNQPVFWRGVAWWKTQREKAYHGAGEKWRFFVLTLFVIIYRCLITLQCIINKLIPQASKSDSCASSNLICSSWVDGKNSASRVQFKTANSPTEESGTEECFFVFKITEAVY